MGWSPPVEELDAPAQASTAWSPPAEELDAPAWSPPSAELNIPSNGSAPLVAVTPSTIFTKGNSVAAPLDGSQFSFAPAPTNPEGTDDLQNVRDATAMTGHLMQLMGGKALYFVGQGITGLGKSIQDYNDLGNSGMNLPDNPAPSGLTQLGMDIHAKANDLVNADPVLRDSWIGNLAGAGGTMGGMTAASMIHPLSAAALFSGGSGEELANAAQQDGQPADVVAQARGIGTLLGAGAAALPLGQLGKLFSRYNINPYLKDLGEGLIKVLPKASVQQRLLYTGIEAAKSGILGATVGAGYQLGMNATRNATTGPNGQVPWNANVAQSAAMFGIPTAIAGAVIPWNASGFEMRPDETVPMKESANVDASSPDEKSDPSQLAWSPPAEELDPSPAELPQAPQTLETPQTGGVSSPVDDSQWMSPAELPQAPQTLETPQTGGVSSPVDDSQWMPPAEELDPSPAELPQAPQTLETPQTGGVSSPVDDSQWMPPELQDEHNINSFKFSSIIPPETVDQWTDLKNARMAAEIDLLKQQIGLNTDRANTLHDIAFVRNFNSDSLDKWANRNLTSDQIEKYKSFFDSDYNQRNGPVDFWDYDEYFNPALLTGENNKSAVANDLVLAFTNGTPSEGLNDKWVWTVSALRKLQELGGSRKDISDALMQQVSRVADSNSQAVHWYSLRAAEINSTINRFVPDLPMDSSQTGSVSGWMPPEAELDPQPQTAQTGSVSLLDAPVLEPSTETALHPSLYPIQEIPLSQLKLSPDVPNFKEGADPVTGVVPGNELSGPYIRLGTAPIVAWHRLNGDKEVITGRHKFELAGRNGETTIPTQLVHESAGFTKQDALILDAESNIRDGQGTVSDYANYFRNSQIDQQSAEAGGLLSRAKGRSGFALGRSASDDLYALYQAGKIPESKAVAIAQAAPGNTALQQVGMKRAPSLSAGEIPGYLALVARQTPPEAQQVGLFGENDAALNQAESLSKAANAKVKEIGDQINAVQGAQKRPEAAAKLGVNVKDPVALAGKLAALKSLRDRYAQFWLHNDLLVSLGAKPVEPSPAPMDPSNVLKADPARSQELMNSIQEGELILKSGKSISGKKLTKEQLQAVQRAVNNDKEKLKSLPLAQSGTATTPTITANGEGNLFGESAMPFNLSGQVDSSSTPAELAESQRLADLKAEQDRNQQPLFDGGPSASSSAVNPQPDSFPPSQPSFKDATNTAASQAAAASNAQKPSSPSPAAPVPGQTLAQQKRRWCAAIRDGWRAHVSLPMARTFCPASIDEAAARTALILRHLNGEYQITLQRAEHALASWRKEFDKTPVPGNWKYDPLKPLPHNYAVIHAIETGNVSSLSVDLQEFVSVLHAQQDYFISQIQQYHPKALRVLNENYFPHVWKDPKAAELMRAAYPSKGSLEGSKGFLKQRTLNYTTDGHKIGLQSISDNPVDIHLFKVAEMGKFIMSHRFHEEVKAAGLLKFVGVFQQPPDGWSKVDDRSFTVYAPPFVTVKEAFDQSLRQGALDFIKKMGWNLNRSFDALKAAGFKQNHWGQWSPADNTITIRPFGADSTIFHEIGHGLDHHYGLSDWINARVPEAVQKVELAAMSKARDPDAKGKHKTYINSREERMAELTAGYVHAPELLHQLAPETAKAYLSFLDAHPELHDLRDLRPGLQRGVDRVQVPVHGIVTLGHYYMPDGAAQVVNNFLSPGLQHHAWYRGLKSISNLMSGAQLGISAFHLGFTSGDAIVSQVSLGLLQLLEGHPLQAAGNFLTSPAAPVTNFVRGWQLQKAMLSPSTNDNESLKKIADLAVQGGLRATIDPFWKTEFTRSTRKSLVGMQMNLSQGEIKAAGGEATRALLNAIPAVMEQAMRPIAEGVVPRQKLGVFAKLMSYEIQRLGPNASLDQLREAAARCADTTEDRMGQLTYDNLFHNKVAKDLMLLSFRAYGWQLGKYRAMAKAAGEAGGAVNSLRKGQRPSISTNLTYPVALLIVFGILGAIIQKLLTGKNPESLADYFFPRSGNLDPSGREQRLALPSYLKDLVSDWHDFPDVQKMGVSVWHKMNPLFSMIADMFNNRDFYGVEIRHQDDPAFQQAIQLSAYVGREFVPFSITGMQKLHDSGASPSQYILPFIGVVPAKQALSMTPAESRAMDLYVGTLPQGSRTQDQADHSKLVGQIRNAMRLNPQAGAQMLVKNAPLLHASDLAEILKYSRTSPLSLQVMKLPIQQGMSIFDLGNPQERQQLAPVLFQKLGAAVNNRTITVPQAQSYLRVLQGRK